MSGDIFLAIEDYIEKNRAELTKIGVVYLFKLTGPDSAWTVDLKEGKVHAGEVGKAGCTLTLSDADFIAMATGKADPMKLFMDKKLRIGGDIMASQKLEFLKKIDPKAAEAAVAAKKASKAPAPAAAATSTAPAKADAQAGRIFAALAQRMGQDASLGKSLGALVQFNVDGKSWLVDGGAGSVREGSDGKASTVITVGDEDLQALVKGSQTVQSLYQHGQLRVDGDIGPAHALGALRGLL